MCFSPFTKKSPNRYVIKLSKEALTHYNVRLSVATRSYLKWYTSIKSTPKSKRKYFHEIKHVLLTEQMHNKCMEGNCANPSCGRSWLNDGVIMTINRINSNGLHMDSNVEGMCYYCNSAFADLDNEHCKNHM